jgi:hypothetical protein
MENPPPSSGRIFGRIEKFRGEKKKGREIINGRLHNVVGLFPNAVAAMTGRERGGRLVTGGGGRTWGTMVRCCPSCSGG